jgi:hypothetical protein
MSRQARTQSCWRLESRSREIVEYVYVLNLFETVQNRKKSSASCTTASSTECTFRNWQWAYNTDSSLRQDVGGDGDEDNLLPAI